MIRRHGSRSLGDMISTVCFFSMSAWLALEGLLLVEDGPFWNILGLLLASVMCFLGGLRFVISQVVDFIAFKLRK